MDFDSLTALPKGCMEYISLARRDADGIGRLFAGLFTGGRPLVRYSLDSYEEHRPIRLPARVWSERRGNCFELSLFWLACLRLLGVRAWYCEKSGWRYKGEVWDHAFVRMDVDGRCIMADPGRRMYHSRFRSYVQLNERQTVGDYYTNCALMINPFPEGGRARVPARRRPELASKALMCARLGLRYYPESDRSAQILKDVRDSATG